MTSKKKEEKTPVVVGLLVLGIPLLVLLADIWLCSYFMQFAKGTWMEFPIYATGGVVAFLDLILLGICANAI